MSKVENFNHNLVSSSEDLLHAVPSGLRQEFTQELAALTRQKDRTDEFLYPTTKYAKLWVLEPEFQKDPYKPKHECECEHETEAQRQKREEQEQISKTLDKYFSCIDQGRWYSLGKDHELSRDEIVDFLSSDKASELTEQETLDLVKVLQRFDEIKGADIDVWDRNPSGITHADVRAYGTAWQSVYDLIRLDKGRNRSAFPNFKEPEISWIEYSEKK